MSNRPSLSLDVAQGFHRLSAGWGGGGVGGRGGSAPSGAKSDAAALECRADEYLPRWPSQIINNSQASARQCQGRRTGEQPTSKQ